MTRSWIWISENSSAIQAVCIVLSAIAAFALFGNDRKISRREKTIEMVLETFFGADAPETYEKFKDFFKRIEAAGERIEDYADNGPKANKADTDILIKQINRYELISLGIRKGVFDEGFFHLWFYSQFMRDYGKLLPYIKKTQGEEANDAFWCEFQTLAQRWSKNVHPVKHPSHVRVLWWLATGNPDKARRALNARKKRELAELQRSVA